ncbi:ABC transporter ATP-binding protein [Virgibacillus sp. MSP4-1]|uniref:ABC transporter ATP-binding protein n=1 Tax=Virgibacillus sp. MSP4-1 TaxID=2700081 RepID=UPI0003A915AD|nr:ABC transporter ATP-binding protein [Virgibacillus sp. MSP4-1]QHS23784.1 ABC transporter ATP-binding protein [Virgibacillus sp. MSP4-1]
MPQQESFLNLKHLFKYFGNVTAVDDISVQIDKGELISFIGPSGCGKTTLLRTIGGFHSQDSGEIILDNDRIDHLPPEKRSTGMVFQNYALFPHMSVYQNVEYGLKIEKVSKSERKERIRQALSQVQLEGYGDRKPSELSGGQQQRVAIARCLVLQPKVLLLDEPLSNLDANLRMIMREEIRRLKDELNLTVIFVTHDQEEALSISDRVVVLNGGVIQQVGAPDEIYNHPENEFVANFVGHSNILEGTTETDNQTTLFKNASVQFEVEKDEDSADRSNGKVMIRPERIAINENSKLQGQVSKVVYNGNFIRYFVDLNGTEILVDQFNVSRTNRFNKGDSIGLEMPKSPHFL